MAAFGSGLRRFFSQGCVLLLGTLCALVTTAEAAPTLPGPPRLMRSKGFRATVARKTRRRKKRRKLSPGETIELNSATRQELMRLPRVGPRTADRILAYRKNIGKFRRLAELRNVQGIGKFTLKKLRPFLEIDGKKQAGVSVLGPVGRRRRRSRANSVYITSYRGRLVMRVQKGNRGRRRAGNCYQRWLRRPKLKKRERVNVNTASLKRLALLPCIGPKRARAILTMRQASGAFRGGKDLQKINGISRRTAAWLKPYVRFKVNPNTASLQELESFPALSRGLGEAIVKDRKKQGPYRTLRDLLRIPGVGRATLHQLRPFFEFTSRRLPALARRARKFQGRTSSRALRRAPVKRRPPVRRVRRKGLPEIEVTDID